MVQQDALERVHVSAARVRAKLTCARNSAAYAARFRSASLVALACPCSSLSPLKKAAPPPRDACAGGGGS
jgi:hypothetical protein